MVLSRSVKYPLLTWTYIYTNIYYFQSAYPFHLTSTAQAINPWPALLTRCFIALLFEVDFIITREQHSV